MWGPARRLSNNADHHRGSQSERSLRLSASMATPIATRCLLRRPSSLGPPPLLSSPSSSSCGLNRRPSPPLRCSSPPVDAEAARPGEGGEYQPSFVDDLLLAFFRSKMVEEVGWDSQKPGYAGLMEIVNRLMIKGKSASEAEQSSVRVLRSLFPPLLLVLYKALLAPIAGGQLASMMLGEYIFVFVQKCKYLEESKCLGICINTCKLPTQFNFGVQPPPFDTDKALKEPCLDICTNARRRRELGKNGSSPDELSCPQV
ncbi:hypothetical protein PR202_ga11142 [Eleusine coracana subsp. coracana]|uniref:Beta-carotene isomerase D27-like C-terminal domain-containing protein n=1 Tax=Eleusine coracana subsp. coracana TaxID=191504 RepID=A0AAV5C8N6_ELECO|nr:hypothetical protein PR202_ga11142 [Eleusine coracana subsp. coracana]